MGGCGECRAMKLVTGADRALARRAGIPAAALLRVSKIILSDIEPLHTAFDRGTARHPSSTEGKDRTCCNSELLSLKDSV
jgi:hypothetical protein